MHSFLYSKSHRRSFEEYYADVFDRLIKDEGAEFRRRFTDEDLYVYITTHTLKHYEISGTGLRSLLDTYVYTKEKAGELDWAHIEAETEKLGISDFEKRCRELSHKVFSDPQNFSPETLSPQEAEMLDYFLSSGAYGSWAKAVNNNFEKWQEKGEKKSHIKYIARRLFPDDEHLKKWFPFFYRHKWLMPFCWIYRVTRALTIRRRRTSCELKALKKIK